MRELLDMQISVLMPRLNGTVLTNVTLKFLVILLCFYFMMSYILFRLKGMRTPHLCKPLAAFFVLKQSLKPKVYSQFLFFFPSL